MHSFVVIFMWRRKFLILSSALLFLVSVWAWAIFYTAYTNNKGAIKQITIQVSQKKYFQTKLSSRKPSLNLKGINKNTEIFTKYGQISGKNAIRYVPPTRDAYANSLSRFRDHL